MAYGQWVEVYTHTGQQKGYQPEGRIAVAALADLGIAYDENTTRITVTPSQLAVFRKQVTWQDFPDPKDADDWTWP
jgi:hypothetical protein